MRLLLAAAAVALAFGAAPVQAATILTANWNSDCSKTTCFNEKGVFTQTFLKGDFAGPVTITQLLLDRHVLGSLDGQTFRLSFQLNGEDLGVWGRWNMSTVLGDELSFTGESFVWDPEAGDLMLVLEIVPPGTLREGGGALFSAFGEAPEEDVFDPPELPQDAPDQGGDRITAPTAAVPEPGTWALMITGFGMAGAVARRRRAVLRVQPQR